MMFSVDFVLPVSKSLSWQSYIAVYVFKSYWAILTLVFLKYVNGSILRCFLTNSFFLVNIYATFSQIYVRFDVSNKDLVLPILVLGFQAVFFFSTLWYFETMLFTGLMILSIFIDKFDFLNNLIIIGYYIVVSYILSRIKRLSYHQEYVTNEQLKDFMNIITHQIDIGAWIIDEEGLKTQYENEKAIKIIEESDFNSLKALLSQKNLIRPEEKDYKETVEIFNNEKNSREFHLLSIKKYIYLGIKCFLIFVTDITPIKFLELNMKRLSDAKDNVMATISHDIRTPLNATIAMNEMALKETTNPQTKFKLDIALKSSKLLLYLIGDFLDFYKSEKTKLLTIMNPINLKTFLKEIVELYFVIIQSRGLEFFLEIYVDPNIEVVTDELKLKRILINLISNAMKYTLKGYISLRILAKKHLDSFFLEFSVIDTGIGISAENLNKIFKPFEQLGNIQNQENSMFSHGIGLGLSISNVLIQCVNQSPDFNKLFVDSSNGQGSVFTFYIPFHPTESVFISSFSIEPPRYQRTNQKALKEISTTFLKTFTDQHFEEYLKFCDNIIEDWNTFPIFHYKNGIMVVEDEETNILVMKMFLKNRPNKVAYLRNGNEAVTFFKKCCQSRIDISIIFMDLNMPVMNGKNATINIRKLESEYQRSPIRIIALTANTMEIERENLTQFGFTTTEMKPISFERCLSYFRGE